MKKLIISLCLSGLVSNLTAAPNDNTIAPFGDSAFWGSNPGEYPTDSIYFGNSSGEHLQTAGAVLALGFFDDGFLETGDLGNISLVYDNFTTIGTVSSEAGGTTFVQYSVQGSVNFLDFDTLGASGKTPYVWLVEGITSFNENDVKLSTSHAIGTSSGWDAIAATSAGDTIQANRPASSAGIDNLIWGSVDNDFVGTINGSFNIGGQLLMTGGFAAVPEPAHISALFALAALGFVYRSRKKRKSV